MLDFSIYLLYRAGTAIVSVLPLRFLFAAGEFLGLSAWVLLRRYRRLACDNLRIAFGTEKSKRELRRLARRHFQRLGANLLCSVKLTGMPVEEILRRIEANEAKLNPPPIDHLPVARLFALNSIV